MIRPPAKPLTRLAWSIGRYRVCWCAARIPPVFARPICPTCMRAPAAQVRAALTIICAASSTPRADRISSTTAPMATSPSTAEATAAPRCKNETSRSFTAGVIFAPFKNFDISADYYDIRLSNEVEYQSSDIVLREEADCLLGSTVTGQPVNKDSPTCQRVIGEVVRNPANGFDPQQITSVLVLPINAAVDRTNGIDFSMHYFLDAQRFGSFSLSAGLTRVISHKTQDFPTDPVDNELTDLFVWELPVWKANGSITWSRGPLSATLFDRVIGGLPNFVGTGRLAPTAIYNGSISYAFSANAQVRLTVDNLLDTKPQSDQTWTSWPFYTRNWFSPVGRDFYLSVNYHFAPRH